MRTRKNLTPSAPCPLTANQTTRLVIFSTVLIITLVIPASSLLLTNWTVVAEAEGQAGARKTPKRISESLLVNKRAVLTNYVGDENLKVMFERNEARPISLASADFDEDGVPDLVGGYALEDKGGVTLHRGNADAIYPNSLEAQKRKADNTFTDAPFLSSARIFPVTATPDFLGAGDFDADGHWDVVTATRGANVLGWLPGDGRGGFGQERIISLQGGVTALVTGEINRADGLTDIVVGVAAAGEYAVVVFENPLGALRAQPEFFALSAEATSLAFGQLDDEYTTDLAIAAGRELVIVHGRDRKSSLDAGRQAEVRPAQIEKQDFTETIKLIAVGASGKQNGKSEISVFTEDGAVQVLHRELEKNTFADSPANVWRRETVLSKQLPQATQLMSVTVDAESAVAAVLPMRLDADGLDDVAILERGHSLPKVVRTTIQSERGVSVAGEETIFPSQKSDTRFGDAPVATSARNESTSKLKASAEASPQMPFGSGCPRTPIDFGQTINGALSTTDCVFLPGTRGGSYFDAYSFNGIAGQNIAISMSSTNFDTYLYLQAPNGSFIAEDDDGGDNTNSRIPPDGGFITLPANGTYTILATSFSPEVTGNYTLALSVESFGGCPVLPIRVGQTVNEALTTTDCIFQPGSPRAGSYVDTYTFNGATNQQIAVTMSAAFDTFLVIIAPNGDFLEDDDGGGGTNSRIPAGGGFLTLGANGTYTIYATSFSPNVTGNYTLTLSGTGTLSTAVTNINDSGSGSLRQAIINANANQGSDTIRFQIGSGARTITPQTALPIIEDTVTIDGTTQPGFAGNPLIELNGTNASFVPAGTPAPPGLGIRANNCVVRGLVINRFNGGQISLLGNNCLIEGNFFDTDLSGANGYRSEGLAVSIAGSGNTIGGTTVAARNIVSGGLNGGIGILGATNQVRGNYVGIGANGATSTGGRGAGVGIIADISDGNVIGGTTAGARNIISGGENSGVIIGFASGNLVQGNFIGTNAGGTSAVGNAIGGIGLLLDGTSGNSIGGTTVAARNVISGNAFAGVTLGLGVSENLVQGNFIGTDVGGNVSISPNQVDGVYLVNSSRNTVGGSVAGARNIISGNAFAGVELYGGPTDVTPDGESRGNQIQGNFIGTNAAGTQSLAIRQQDGIFITIVTGSAENSIGGLAPEMRNIISGNNRNGVSIGIFNNRAVPSLKGSGMETPTGSGGRGILVQNNFIGTDVSGNACLGNNGSGVFIDADSTTNTIRSNTIACNGTNGVTIPDNRNPGVRNELDDNLIYGNAGLGVDLGNPGITPNDPLDTDAGANFLQNFPEPASFTTSLTLDPAHKNSSSDDTTFALDPIETNRAVTVNFTLPSTPNSDFTVHWYFSTAAQCSSNNTQSPVRPAVSGKLNVRADARGIAPVAISFAFPVGVTSGVVNCTATPVQGTEVGSTSEFSPCQVVNNRNIKRRRTGLGRRGRIR